MKCAAFLMVLLCLACVSAQTGLQQGPPMNIMSLLAMRNVFDNFLPTMLFMNPQLMNSFGGGGPMANLFLLSAFN